MYQTIYLMFQRLSHPLEEKLFKSGSAMQKRQTPEILL